MDLMPPLSGVPGRLSDPALGPLWQAAAGLPDRPGPAEVDRLRRGFPQVEPELVRAVSEQTLLRRRALAKLGPAAERLWFTAAGLEQASRPAAAAHRVRRLRAAGVRELADLGCGIGVDALVAATAGLRVRAVELDPDTAAMAAANLAGKPAEVLVGDARELPLPAATAAFWDPARRSAAGRAMDPERWRPPWSWLARFADDHPATVVKAAPGLPHELRPRGGALEWLSVAGDLVETCVWFPGLRGDLPERAAVILDTDPENPGQVLPGTGPDRPAAMGELRQWLVEPDPAVIRGHLVAELAERIDATLLSPGIAYLSCDTAPATPFARAWRIVETLPAQPKALRAELRRRDVGAVEIRSRGLDLDPHRLRRELRLSGTQSAHLAVTRIAGKPAALLLGPPG